MVDDTLKRELREKDKCNIVEFYPDKVPDIVAGTNVLRPLQSEKEFEKLLESENWGITSTIESSIILTDLDTTDYDRKFNKLFTRSRRSYKDNNYINSKHGILRVTDAQHDWCVKFTKTYHDPGNLELFAEKQNMIVAGTYNSKKEHELEKDEKMPVSTWNNTDDTINSPIISITKKELDELFAGKIKSNKILNYVDSTFSNDSSLKDYNNYDLGELLRGKFTKGFRRRKLNSTYGKLRRERWSIKHCSKEILKINSELDAPLTDKEMRYILKNAENFYQNTILPSLNIDNNTIEKVEKEQEGAEKKETRGRKKKTYEEIGKNDDLENNDDSKKKTLDVSKIKNAKGGFTLTEFTDLMISKYHFATMTDTSEVFFYEDGGYVAEGEIIVKQICEYTIIGCKNDDVSEVLEKVRRRTYHKRSEFDNFKDGFLNFTNCRLDPITKEIREYSHKDLVLTRLPIKYDPKAKCPKIMKFLKQCLPNNHDRHNTLEELASTLLPELKLEKAYMHLGDGGNGKSTWFNVIEHFLGKENHSSLSIHDMIHDKFKRPELYGVIANIYAEIAKKEIKELDIFKLIISGDSITADKKNKNPFKFNPIAKHFFSANKLPQLEEETDAVFRRFNLTMWNQQFVQEEEGTDNTTNKADLDLKYTLVTDDELSGLLNIILIIRNQLQERGRLLYSKTIKQMRHLWLSESNTITKYCGHFDVVDGWLMLRSDFLRFYRDFCLKILHESPEAELDVIKKVEKELPMCKFGRKRYAGSKNLMQVVENINFKDVLGKKVGYDSGDKAKKTSGSMTSLFNQ